MLLFSKHLSKEKILILVDFNQIALANIFIFMGDLKNADEKEMLDICRHGIINTLISYKKKFGAEYGDLIITADAGNYWRKDVFPEYKANRYKDKEESDFNWELAWKCLNQVRDEIQAIFPWRFLRVKRCEADDIIAVLCKYSQDNEYITSGLIDEPQPMLIISSDGDDAQLGIYENIRQWCPKKKTYLPRKSKKDLKLYMVDHVVKGDTGDGVPNIFMRSTFFLDRKEKERQKTVTQKILDSFLEHGIDAIDLLPKEKDESEKDYQERLKQIRMRYVQNKTVVLFEHIPDYISESILQYYHDNPSTGTLDNVRKYFIKNRMRLLMEELTSV